MNIDPIKIIEPMHIRLYNYIQSLFVKRKKLTWLDVVDKLEPVPCIDITKVTDTRLMFKDVISIKEIPYKEELWKSSNTATDVGKK